MSHDLSVRSWTANPARCTNILRPSTSATSLKSSSSAVALPAPGHPVPRTKSPIAGGIKALANLEVQAYAVRSNCPNECCVPAILPQADFHRRACRSLPDRAAMSPDLYGAEIRDHVNADDVGPTT